MHRYTNASSGAGVGNSGVGSARENARAESSFSTSNYNPNPRRASQLTPYNQKCDKEPINGRLGAPDFYPQTPHCAEETLTREYIQSGYKETVDGIEEAREIVLTQATYFSKSEIIVKCKEAIRKRFRAVNESRAQKRKAGQVYGVPLSGSLLIKPGVFPEQRPCSEEFRRKWIEALSQHHKRLRSLSEQVPHGYRRKSLFEVLIRYNVPLLRATWFIKVTYLNQVRPASTSVSSASPDKAQLTRTELWTKDVIEYLQYLLDEFFTKDGSFTPTSSKDQSSHISSVGQAHHKIDSAVASPDAEIPSLQFKWWYMVRLLRWHFAERLLLPSPIIEWALNVLQEKASTETLELLLPVLINVMESITLSQTYVRIFVDVAVRSINDLSPGDLSSSDDPKKNHFVSTLAEMLRYLVLTVPDTFVSLDCFPLPPCVVPDAKFKKSVGRAPGSIDSSHFDSQEEYLRHLSFGYFISSIQTRASSLATIANPCLQGHGAAKVVQALDKALIVGDARYAYSFLYEDLSDASLEERWIAEVSPCLRSSLKWIGTVSSSLIYSVFFLSEWATCDYRDSQTSPRSLKFTGRQDFSPVYLAVLLLKLKMEEMVSYAQSKNGSLSNIRTGFIHDNYIKTTVTENIFAHRNSTKGVFSKNTRVDIFQSPGPLHDIVVCWLDQHGVEKGGGFNKRLQVFLMELIRFGIFYPQAYVRQLIISGIMDRNASSVDLERQRRHQQILKQLPGSCLFEVLEDAGIAEASLLNKTVEVYSNERRLVLHGFCTGNSDHINARDDSCFSSALQKQKDQSSNDVKDCSSTMFQECRRNSNAASSPLPFKHNKIKPQVTEVKILISDMLHLPQPSMSIETQFEESQGSLKRSIGSFSIKDDLLEVTAEECHRAKRQRLGDESSSSFSIFSLSHSDDEDTWWAKKEPKPQEPSKAEPQLKLTKNASRGRQKNVRRTQSLAQLAAARIESSQGASTSHVCENKVNCLHHGAAIEGEIPKDTDRMKAAHPSEIGKSLKRLRLLEKRSISIWLLTTIKQLVEANEKPASKASNFLPGDDMNSIRWRLGDDELSSILFIFDTCSDLISAVKLLLWLLPKILGGASTTGHVGRNVMQLPRSRENHVCQAGDAFILSCLQRYENVLVVADMLPDLLTAAMHRSVAMVANGNRLSNPVFLSYARSLLKKYRDVASVTKWEKNFRAACDQRLLAELDAGRALDSDAGLSSGIPSVVEDFDEYFRQKMSGRMTRTGPTMKEIVHRQVEEAVHYFYGKERKLTATSGKNPLEKWDDPYQIAKDIVLNLGECIRQSGGSSQEWDHSIVASAVSAIVGNIGSAIGKLPDFATSSNSLNSSSTINSLNCARHILQIHTTSLCLLKESLGERMSRIFDISLAAEASSTISVAFAPVKSHRNQFQQSPETHDINPVHSSDVLHNPAKVHVGRAVKAAAAVSALAIGAIVRGVSTLERMVTVLKLKEGLDVLQFIRSARSNSNGSSRSFGTFKLDHCVEVYVHWFRLLIGNCRTVLDGLVAEILGESHILALSRMQRMLPLSLILPPAYSIFAMVIWKPYILNSNIANGEDKQLYQYLILAIGEAIRHQPFRDLCLRNTHVLYDLLASDVSDSEFAAMLELHNPDKHLKTLAFVPLRARLFLNAIVDCKMPPFTLMLEDGSWVTGSVEQRAYAENESKLSDQLIRVLDNLQPAKFHWQWVELRLLLHEQALIEKIETHNMSFVDAIRSLSPNAENFALSENERNLTEIILTRILVRPDAAPLYSEFVHLLGRSLEESLVMDIKWILAGNDVLLGRKSIKQQLIHIAQRKNLSTKTQLWKPWGWSSPTKGVVSSRGNRRRLEAISIEEGEVVDDCIDTKKSSRTNLNLFDAEGAQTVLKYPTERSLAELLLPCIDRSSTDLRTAFATDLIKQLTTIDQQINTFIRGGNKHAGVAPSGADGSSNKGSSRKGLRGGSPGLGRRPTAAADSTPPSAAALRASMWLRLQILLRLLPVFYSDSVQFFPSNLVEGFIYLSREPSARNMKYTLASIILKLLGTRIVYEDTDLSLFSPPVTSSKREAECLAEVPTLINNSAECLFDTFLYVFYGLLSNSKPSWMKPSPSKSTVKSSRDFSAVDREVAEALQADLDRMELPASIRSRIQAAMPMLPPSISLPISCHPPTLSSTAIMPLQPNTLALGPHPRNITSTRPSSTIAGRRTLPSPHDSDMEIDPWTMLEDGAGFASASSSGNNMAGASGDHSNLKACSWLKGAVRVRRTDLTYVGALDDDR